ncbi:MAG: pentapeptide repeat-containing protein [Deltaproteobacteria bacterium]
MADQKLIDILSNDVEEWNALRKKGVIFRPDLADADLSGARLSGAHLSRANLHKALLRGADLSRANLSGAHLSEADLSDADLWGANLSDSDLRGAHLSKAELCEADLIGADLSNADLREANLSKTHLSEADFRGANLSKADLSEADLFEAKLQRTNFHKATLIRANLKKADITGAKLYGTIRDNWKIEDIRCRYVYWDQEGKEPTPAEGDFDPGEFERKYSYFKNIMDIVLNLPYSDFPFYIGKLTEKIINQKLDLESNLILFKACEAMDSNKSFLKFLLFSDEIATLNQKEKQLRAIQDSINAILAEGQESSGNFLKLRENLPFPHLPIDVKPKNIVHYLNERYAALSPLLERIIEAIQKAC